MGHHGSPMFASSALPDGSLRQVEGMMKLVDSEKSDARPAHVDFCVSRVVGLSVTIPRVRKILCVEVSWMFLAEFRCVLRLPPLILAHIGWTVVFGDAPRMCDVLEN